MEEKMTVEKALEVTANLLREIKVPVGLMQDIGFPINAAIGNIEVCIDAIKQQGVKEDGNADTE